MQPNAPPSDDRAVVRPGGDLLEGTPYRVIQPVASGGMGEVLDAEHRALGHRVVVKVLRDVLAARPDMRDRMRVEGQALARIRHPHLVMVTDFGETRAGHQFIVMEHLVGRSLREALQDEPLPPVAEAAEIARQVLLGLHAAHEAGVVHRDVKPENVFLCATEDGRPFVKVLDFGVAKIVQSGRDPRTPLPLVVPTAEGVSLGTPRYFSPEQARGERDLDARSDVYAAGLVLHEMLAGQVPFSHYVSIDQIVRAHVNEDPVPPSAIVRSRVPAALDGLVMRALAKPREERYPTALAFAEEIERFLVSFGPEVRVSDGPRPVFAGVPDARSLAEAPTSPALEMGAQATPPGATGPTHSGEKVDLRSTSRKLSDAPVVIDRLVERVLSKGPERAATPTAMADTVPAQAITPTVPVHDVAAPAGRGSVPDTVPLLDVPPAPATPRPGRASVPETVPMFEIAPAPRASAPAAQLAAPAPDAAFRSDRAPSPGAAPLAPRAPEPLTRPAAPAWRLPAALGAALVVLAFVAFALVRFVL